MKQPVRRLFHLSASARQNFNFRLKPLDYVELRNHNSTTGKYIGALQGVQ